MPLFKAYAPYVTIQDEVYPAIERCIAESAVFAKYYNHIREQGNILNMLTSPAKRGPQYIMTLNVRTYIQLLFAFGALTTPLGNTEEDGRSPSRLHGPCRLH